MSLESCSPYFSVVMIPPAVPEIHLATRYGVLTVLVAISIFVPRPSHAKTLASSADAHLIIPRLTPITACNVDLQASNLQLTRHFREYNNMLSPEIL